MGLRTQTESDRRSVLKVEARSGPRWVSTPDSEEEKDTGGDQDGHGGTCLVSSVKWRDRELKEETF